MKKLFLTLFCCAAAGLFAVNTEVITPPAGKTVRVPVADNMSVEAGGFAVDFTLDFNDPAKNYVGYMISCRNWVKPFRGFAFGVNRINNKTSIWFYPMDEEGKAFGFYNNCNLEPGKRYRAEVIYIGRRCTLTIDGKVVASATFNKDIRPFDSIEIGGLGNKYRDVTVHGFQFLDVKKK